MHGFSYLYSSQSYLTLTLVLQCYAKAHYMGTIWNFRDIYFNAFNDCRPRYLVVILKIYSVFSALMISMAVYALLYRAFTGFEF